MKLTPKEQQLRALREARYGMPVTKPVSSRCVTKSISEVLYGDGPEVVMGLASLLTPAEREQIRQDVMDEERARGGRPRIHATNADKQRAYRARRKGNA